MVLDGLEEGIHVKEDGTFEYLEHQVVRVDEAACHPVLMTLWEEHGLHLLESMFNMQGPEAQDILERQSRRKQGFGAFLRQIDQDRSIEDRLRLLPWSDQNCQSLWHSRTA